jgi:DNA polymerase
LYTHGGKLAENVTQALCRDLLAHAMLRVERAGWPIVLHVHDEIVAETGTDATAAELCDMMCELPPWAAGFPLAAEGSVMMRYAK